jgi:hypothetical protein
MGDVENGASGDHAEHLAGNGDGVSDAGDGQVEHWRDLRTNDRRVPAEQVALREGTLGRAAAIDAVQSEPDAFWVNAAQGVRAVDRSRPAPIRELFHRAQTQLAKRGNGGPPRRAPDPSQQR